MKRSDFFKGMWLSPLALARGPETPPNSSSTIGVGRDAALTASNPRTPTPHEFDEMVARANRLKPRCNDVRRNVQRQVVWCGGRRIERRHGGDPGSV